MTNLRAVIVCVDYYDYLELTLPYNRHHFDEVMVVTSLDDLATWEIARENKASVFRTDAFYEDGADFNKWLALELALERFGREGQMVLMDADILWPRTLPTYQFEFGKLYTPVRRMCVDFSGTIPHEDYWRKYRIHNNLAEWAGYSQIFHASDPVLPVGKYWHETNWRHAGGADSFFQLLWKDSDKIRPPWEVLHLGEAGRNWCGRTTPFLSGETSAAASSRREKLNEYMRLRSLNRDNGIDRFREEKLPAREEPTE